MLKGIIYVLVFALFMALIAGVSWISTCGIIYLITLCFGWEFSWLTATGIWLIMCLLCSVFKPAASRKK